MIITPVKLLVTSCILCLLAGASVVSAASGQLGVGYGKQLLGNKDISQFELFYRMPLSYQKDLGDVWKLSTALEFSGAVIDDSESETSSTGRLSLMPQLVLSPNDTVHFVFGVGSGFMMGETDIDDHNLGGPFFLSSKFGILLFMGQHFGIEYNYYHQSNAGIYNHNASLNMHHAALSYRF
ncbi:MAG: hypothetical protein ACI8PB_002636 [Desulforhopalus sp.]|jgi:hypothetical protein